MDVPSMVQRSGDTFIIRSVVSGNQLYWSNDDDNNTSHTENRHHSSGRNYNHNNNNNNSAIGETVSHDDDIIVDNLSKLDESGVGATTATTAKTDDDSSLPQCKIKRNYSCNSCNFFTQNPRHFLAHLRDIHGEKIIINECKYCLYASRHYQKLVRHMKMVHGSTDGLEEQAQSRKRASQLAREQKKRKITLDDSVVGLTPTTTLMLGKTSATPPPSLPSQNRTSADGAAMMSSTNEIANEVLNQKFLKCSLCDFTTLHRNEIVEHEREEHNKTKFFRCQKCSYVTHIKARFSKHVKYHSMPMIKCVMCDFRTPYKWNLDRHMKNHGGAGPFKCSACNFTADIKQSLTVHEMNHHVPPVGHASGMSMARRRNKVGGTDIIDNYNAMNAVENNVVAEAPNNDDDYDDDALLVMPKVEMSESPPAKDMTPKRASRPVPNLIPIQPIPSNDAINLTVRSKIRAVDEAQLKEPPLLRLRSHSVFGSLFNLTDEQFEGSESSQLSPASSVSSAKRKSTNFFSELKKNFAAGNRDEKNLMCECGYAAKCLSEALIHKKTCGKRSEKQLSASPINLSVSNCGGSTRCQYCRHRCKSSADLMVHLQSCVEARSSADSLDSASEVESINEKVDVSGDITDEGLIDMTNEPHPMENKVFVWNKLPLTNASATPSNSYKSIEMQNNELGVSISGDDSENNDDEKADDSTYYGVETAPGYGEVTKKMNPEEDIPTSSLKKVFKCPHCSFWASTASRFHVHIVGHLNKKPFECSLCSYRSNWRWDITKHIRLKTIRDISHQSAKVLMNDETGRRNYTKYNKYITLMKVTEEDGDPKLMKSGEMTPSQEASINSKGNQSIANDESNYGINFSSESLNAFGENAQQQFNVSDRTNDGGEAGGKKVSFKCKKCNYRHVNRDVVLAHVKTHYRQSGSDDSDKDNSSATTPAMPALTALPSEYNNNVCGFISAANKLLLHSAQQQSQLGNAAAAAAVLQNATSGAQSLQSSDSTKSTIVTNVPATNSTNENNNNNGEMDEASSRAVNGWRDAAPYRCGHCHQVSNWKHVIQRHCRLKHNGIIRIEMTEKGSNVYQPLATSSGTSNTITSTTMSSSTEANTDKNASTSNAKNITNAPTLLESLKVPTETIQTIDPDQRKLIINFLANSTHASQLGILNAPIAFALTNGQVSAVNFQCKLCNFEAPNAFALNHHIQLHLNDNIGQQQSQQSTNKNVQKNDTIIDLDEDGDTNDKTETNDATAQRSISEKQIEKIQKLRNQPQHESTNETTIPMSTASPEPQTNEERCPHCPFETDRSDILKEHLLCHMCVSGQVNLANCDFCDFSIADESLLAEHTNIHFKMIKNKQKSVAFYTSYDGLEINMIDRQNNNNDNCHPNQYMKTLFPKLNNIDLQYSSDKENKILVDVNTGQIVN